MYPQVTASSDEIDPLNTSADIASIGFPGMRQQYRRRLGPDGEEADDIIGPDGHTEQLPPYTKYAITAPMPPKIQTHETNVPSSSSSTQEAYHAANSATSMSDRLLPPITYGSSPEVGGGGSQSIGPHRQKWSEKSKKRTCFGRLPLWVVVMIIVALIIMSAVMGGVIGRLLAKQKASSDHRNVNQT